MRLTARLLLYGAVVPAALMLVGFGVTGALLRSHLVGETDRDLLAQAAIESVSLFDGLVERPHLHLARSPLSSRVQGFMPEGALYDPSGRRVASTGSHRHAPASLTSEEMEGHPVFSSTRRGASTIRALHVVVLSPDDERYVLWVGTPLDATERTMAWYTRTAAAIVIATVLLSLLVQGRHARSIVARLDRLALHMAGLRARRFDVPPADPEGDVISDLRDAAADTTQKLRVAYELQERFVADAAHELRTPLTAMRTLIDTALRRERSADELREVLEGTRAEVDRLASLSSELLDRAAIGQADAARESIDLTVLVNGAVDGVRPLADARDITIESAIERGCAALPSVPAELRRALDNLLSNAVKFAPGGSTVRIGVALRDERLRFLVTDEGEGVPAAESESVFEPFHRGSAAVERGAGLGLSIVREIARRHGGDAWIEASAEQRAGFAFDVLLAPGAQA